MDFRQKIMREKDWRRQERTTMCMVSFPWTVCTWAVSTLQPHRTWWLLACLPWSYCTGYSRSMWRSWERLKEADTENSIKSKLKNSSREAWVSEGRGKVRRLVEKKRMIFSCLHCWKSYKKKGYHGWQASNNKEGNDVGNHKPSQTGTKRNN